MAQASDETQRQHPTEQATHSPHFTEDRTVQTYTRIHLPRVFTPWAGMLLEAVPTPPGAVVLDVATGPGTVARQAAVQSGPSGRVTGVDFSAAMLSAARAWPAEPGAAPIEYVEASAASIPLPDATFDVAYCQQGLQHIADPLSALREMRRVLKPGGLLGVAIWTRSPFGIFRTVVSEVAGTDAGPQPSTFGRDPEQLASTLRDLGFHDVHVQTREMVSVLEGGIPQAIEVGQATSGGAALERLSPAGQQAVREAMARALVDMVVDGAVHLPSASNIASARSGGA
jgi:ubiquinone/menaquinone biosynthesis C-methylase UbiE